MSASLVFVVCGLAIGVVSRVVNTAQWAPVWAGNLLSPWLLAAWLAGATTTDPGRGSGRGLGLLAGVAIGYLATAGTDAGRLALALAALALVAGPAIGWAAASWHRGSRWASAGPVVLGSILLAEGLLLQVGPRSTGERFGFAVEAFVGPLVALRLGGWRGGVLAIPTGAGILLLQLLAVSTFGLTLG